MVIGNSRENFSCNFSALKNEFIKSMRSIKKLRRLRIGLTSCFFFQKQFKFSYLLFLGWINLGLPFVTTIPSGKAFRRDAEEIGDDNQLIKQPGF